MGFLNEMPKYRTQILASLLLFWSFFLFACRVIIIGSTLLDLQIQLEEGFATTSRLVTSHAVGYVIGTFSVSFLDKYSNHYFAMGVGMIASGAAIFLTPLIFNFYILMVILFISGVANANYDLNCHIAMTLLWDSDKVGNAIQIMQMFYGIGALSCPAFVRYFLLPVSEEMMENPEKFENVYSPSDVQLKCPYFIYGGASILTSIGFFYYYFNCPNISTDQIEEDTNSKIENQSPEKGLEKLPPLKPPSKHPTWKINLAIFWASAIHHAFLAVNSIVSNYVQAFGIKSSLKIEKKTGALISSSYWTSFSLTRVIFVALTTILSENLVVNICLVIAGLGTVIMYGFLTTNPLCLWASSILIGAGFSPLFPVAFVMISKFFPLTGSQTSIIFGAGVLGDSLHAAMAGTLIEYEPMVYGWYLAIVSTVFIFLSASLPYVCDKLFGEPMKVIPEVEMKARRSRVGSFMVPPVSGQRSRAQSLF
ncbi:sodium-dependent glucose transporter 1A-like [Brevipalpus obovatus]|uniref:sodium-dependent glucose transporter 1A-like n=1 Tax=Brevipalpus obovatus TaxID=246614 RepID=UPI003D9E595A